MALYEGTDGVSRAISEQKRSRELSLFSSIVDVEFRSKDFAR